MRAPTDDLTRSFLDLWWHFDPVAATLRGLPEHDGRWAPWDDAGTREHAAALRAIAGAAEDLDVEDLADEIDRTALLDHLRVQIFRLEHERPQVRNPALWVEHACLGLYALLARPADGATAAAALARLAGLPGFFAAAREAIGEPPLLLVEAALAELDGLAPLVEACGRRFAHGWVAAGDDAATVLSEAEVAVDRLRLALRTEIAPHPEPSAVAIGEAEVDRRLHHEHASRHNAAELWRSANRFAAEAEREVIAAAMALETGRAWREVYESVRDEGIVTDDLITVWEGAIEAASAHARRSGLAPDGMPPLPAAEAPAFAMVLEPVADYLSAGVSGTPTALLSAPAEVADAPTADWYRGEHDRHRLAWLAVRFGVPGRHLFELRRAALDRLVRREVAVPSAAHAWGLYAEALMVEEGFEPHPAARLAQRVLVLRDAQLALVDVGLHTKQLTPAEAIDQLVGRLPVDQHTALADVRRLACRPLSACGAMLGFRELLRLREDARAAAGGGFDQAAFHDALLGYGGLPAPLIRWGLGLDA